MKKEYTFIKMDIKENLKKVNEMEKGHIIINQENYMMVNGDGKKSWKRSFNLLR